MPLKSRKFFLGAAGILLFGAIALASGHHRLNGTWVLQPTRSDFAGYPAIATGTVTINDREHNIYISRSFSYDGANQSFHYSFSTDGHEHTTVHGSSDFMTKAKWEGDTLVLHILANGVSSVERYNLMPDGEMMLAIEREGRPRETLFFARQ